MRSLQSSNNCADSALSVIEVAVLGESVRWRARRPAILVLSEMRDRPASVIGLFRWTRVLKFLVLDGEGVARKGVDLAVRSVLFREVGVQPGTLPSTFNAG